MKTLAILEKDVSYGKRLGDFIGSRKENEFVVHVFTSRETLETFRKEHKIDILLSCPTEVPRLKSSDGEQILILSEGDRVQDAGDLPMVYKYQPADSILREIRMASRIHEEPQEMEGSNCISTVYSPVKRCGKSTFAIGLAKELSLDGQTLLLNLEMFSGLHSLFPYGEYDIGDVMYYFMQGKEIFASQFPRMIVGHDHTDYIRPAGYGGDIGEVGSGDWIHLIQTIAGFGCYEHIVVDAGDLAGDITRLLESSSQIYIPTLEDRASVQKIEELKEFWLRAGKEELLNRCTFVALQPGWCIGQGITTLDDPGWKQVKAYIQMVHQQTKFDREAVSHG